MKNSTILTTSLILGSVVLASCSTSNLATSGASDNMYFMASDARMVNEYAVQNNNPDSFQNLNSLDTDSYSQENFSSRNVNPDYISRYQADETADEDEVVYFDEDGVDQGNPDINVYNNYYVGGAPARTTFNSALAFNMGFMSGFNPWGFGFYDPFWGPSWGFRPGLSLNLGFGFGYYSSFFRPSFGYRGFYDPFWGPTWGNPYFGWGGYPMYNSFYSYRPTYILPGGEYANRRVIRSSRPTRGATLAGSNYSGARSAALPSTARAQARRDAMGTASRNLVSSERNRVSARDFGSSQNDYYNSGRSRVESSRNVNSPAMNRSSATRSRSAMLSARPSYGTSNSRSSIPSRGMNNYNNSRRGISPSYNRSMSPSYNRSTAPGRTSSPSYNRGSGTNTRTYTPSRSNNSSSFSSGRSSSGGFSSGGGSVSSGGSRGGGGSVSSGSRGGRGN
ncbi:hypothetical protein [Algoriphagus sp. CAU 1675]|uniref:hypothetical protein n=1 Tax=Algoriphagus sp. CAU 1675 TaxID=3032597 RepID=UPI0023DC1AA3|nr:hypothetical protein [Algoriphagus sp. CAU 1675]MDF2158451.1 hypothetical protein [Algoriphagus sp. CAU 1675]